MNYYVLRLFSSSPFQFQKISIDQNSGVYRCETYGKKQDTLLNIYRAPDTTKISGKNILYRNSLCDGLHVHVVIQKVNEAK